MEIEPVTIRPTSPKRAARGLEGRWTLLLCCSAPAGRPLSGDQSCSSQRPWLRADLFANHHLTVVSSNIYIDATSTLRLEGWVSAFGTCVILAGQLLLCTAERHARCTDTQSSRLYKATFSSIDMRCNSYVGRSLQSPLQRQKCYKGFRRPSGSRNWVCPIHAGQEDEGG